MSQAGTVVAGGAPGLPVTFQADTGSAQPDAFGVINFVTPANGGITTSAAGNTVTISLTNRVYDTATTIGHNTAHTVNFAMSATTAGTYTWDFSIAGYDAINNLSVGYTLVGATKTDGSGTGALINGQALDEFEDFLLVLADTQITVVGNTVRVDVLGVAGETIDWTVTGYYTLAN
jgi:hypothetical protein